MSLHMLLMMIWSSHRTADTRWHRTSFVWLWLAVALGPILGCSRAEGQRSTQAERGRATSAVATPVAQPAANTGTGNAEPPKRQVATRTKESIKLDGVLDEAAWRLTPSTGVFVDPLTGNPGVVTTEARLLWDNQYLYIGVQNVDSDVWADLNGRDAELWTQDAFEVMIDTDGNGKGYIELVVAPNGNIFDAYLPTPHKYEDSADPNAKPYSWNSGLKAAVHVDGTLDNRNDKDGGWSVELALPLADANGLQKERVRTPPIVADLWNINLFRLEALKDKGQLAVAWIAPMGADRHRPDRFGELVFGNEQGEYPPPWPQPDAAAMREAEANWNKHGRTDSVAEAKKNAKRGEHNATKPAAKTVPPR